MLTVILNSRQEIYGDSAAQQDMDILLTAFLNNKHESGADGATLTTDTNSTLTRIYY
jgi:hypothetical protein